MHVILLLRLPLPLPFAVILKRAHPLVPKGVGAFCAKLATATSFERVRAYLVLKGVRAPWFKGCARPLYEGLRAPFVDKGALLVLKVVLALCFEGSAGHSF